jgi:hypothetical protein
MYKLLLTFHFEFWCSALLRVEERTFLVFLVSGCATLLGGLDFNMFSIAICNCGIKYRGWKLQR